MTGKTDEEKLLEAVAILNAKTLGLILGIIFGLVIFIATNWLVLKGPQPDESGRYLLGPHLQLLSQFFIGYRVSFFGSIIGFIYGFAVGTFGGALIGWVYNRIVSLRQKY
jgi:hypothetical protein